MTVYIESVIIDNFFVTFLIALLSFRVISVKVSYARTIIASIIGTVVAVFYPFMKVPNFLLILIKLTLGILLSFILFYKKANVLKGGGAFLLITALFGGAMFAIGFIIYADINKALTLPATNIPIGIIIAGALLIYFFLRKVIMRKKRIADASSYIFNAELDIFNKTVKGRAFLDTGNRLYDEVSGLPIIVLNIKMALEILDSGKLAALLENRGEEISKDAHYIKYNTVGSKTNKILVLKPDEIRLYLGKDEHIIKDVVVGLSMSKFSDAIEYDMILPPSII